jgi:hypothetical protein
MDMPAGRTSMSRLRSLAAAACYQAEAEAGAEERQAGGLGDRGGDVDRERVRGRARAEGVEINAGGESEGDEALVVIGRGVRQGRARGVARRNKDKASGLANELLDAD